MKTQFGQQKGWQNDPTSKGWLKDPRKYCDPFQFFFFKLFGHLTKHRIVNLKIFINHWSKP